MIPFKKVVASSVGKKFIMALTGLSLVGFVIAHLAGNLLLYKSSGDAFNIYADKLESLGQLKIFAEVMLVLLFGTHIVTAINTRIGNKQARPVSYKTASKSKGGNTKSNLSSLYMAVTGVLILVFLVIHIRQFTLGPGVAAGYVATVDGHEMRDLHKLVMETFASPVWMGFYVFIMLLLGLHLRHGFWSAFQSLGMLTPRYSKPIYATGVVLAILLAVGFLGIPVFMFMNAAPGAYQ